MTWWLWMLAGAAVGAVPVLLVVLAGRESNERPGYIDFTGPPWHRRRVLDDVPSSSSPARGFPVTERLARQLEREAACPPHDWTDDMPPGYVGPGPGGKRCRRVPCVMNEYHRPTVEGEAG